MEKNAGYTNNLWQRFKQLGWIGLILWILGRLQEVITALIKDRLSGMANGMIDRIISGLHLPSLTLPPLEVIFIFFNWAGIVLVVSVFVFAYLDTRRPNKIWIAKESNLSLFVNQPNAELVTLKVSNREWRYLFELVSVSIQYRKPTNIPGKYKPYSGALRWLPSLSSSAKKIYWLRQAEVELIRIDPRARKFSITYGYTNSGIVEFIEFTTGQYKFYVTLTGTIKRGRLEQTITQEYNLEVTYTEDEPIFVEMKKVSAKTKSREVNIDPIEL